MSNILEISHKLDISSNMEQLAISMKKDIDEKYNLIVTEDSLSETKKLMAEINKEKTEFKTTYKGFKDKVLEPLTALDKKAKEIEGYFDDARTALKNQVDKYEATKLEQAKKVCIEYTMEQCELKGIDFNSIVISDLFVKLGSVTATGNISGTAKSEIDTRIQKVENEILKAKLEAEEKAKRDREIAENARLEAEQKARERESELLLKAEREKNEAVEKAKQEIRQEVKPVIKENLTTPFDEPKQEPKPTLTDDGKRVYRFSFNFEIKALVDVDLEKLTEKVKSMMLSEAGLSNLKNVEVN